jgi:hypothetical protein
VRRRQQASHAGGRTAVGAGEVGSRGVGRRLPEEVPVPGMTVGTGGWSCSSVKLLVENGGTVKAAEPRCLGSVLNY